MMMKALDVTKLDDRYATYTYSESAKDIFAAKREELLLLLQKKLRKSDDRSKGHLLRCIQWLEKDI